MGLFRVPALPEEALAASAVFHADVLPRIEALLADAPSHLALLFAPADHTHHGWRLAAVQGLAREHVPVRVNALVGEDDAVVAAALRYLEAAPGVTGQLLPLDGNGAGNVL